LEWLLGRVAAKDAVRQWARDRHGLQLAPTAIAILPSALGKPLIDCPAIAAFGPVPDVSISHNRGSIVAALSEPGTPIGIDLARATDVRSTDMLRKSFLETEIALLDRRPNGNPTTAALHFWCAKAGRRATGWSRSMRPTAGKSWSAMAAPAIASASGN
jgi:phosphopantetheinyl transferase